MKRAMFVGVLALTLVLAMAGIGSAHVTGGAPSPTMTLNPSGNAAKWEGSTVECTAGEEVSLGGRVLQGSTKATGNRTEICTGAVQAIEPLFVVVAGGPLVPGPAEFCGAISTKAGGAVDFTSSGCSPVTLV